MFCLMKRHKSPKADIFSQYRCTVSAADAGTRCLNKERAFGSSLLLHRSRFLSLRSKGRCNKKSFE